MECYVFLKIFELSTLYFIGNANSRSLLVTLTNIIIVKFGFRILKFQS